MMGISIDGLFFWCSVSFDEPMFHPLFNSLQLLFLIGVLYQKHKTVSYNKLSGHL